MRCAPLRRHRVCEEEAKVNYRERKGYPYVSATRVIPLVSIFMKRSSK
jgi:hypothetical protein